MDPLCLGWGCVNTTTSTAFCGKVGVGGAHQPTLACVHSYAKWFAEHYHKSDFDTNHVRIIFGTDSCRPSREAEKTQVDTCLRSICDLALAKFRELLK